MLFSVDLTTAKLEALLMTTRDEMLAALTDLSNKVADEAAQSKDKDARSKAILDSMTEVVASLKAQIESLKETAGASADFSVESAKIADIEASIASIIETPVVPPVETPVVPVEAPIVSPVETTVVPPVEVAGFPPIDPIVPPVVMPIV